MWRVIGRTLIGDRGASFAVTDVAAAKRALARLARREAPHSPWRSHDGPAEPVARPAATIHEAETAVEDLERAAKFVAGGGRAQLEGAVERAEHAADHALSVRGQDALAAFERFERACRSDGSGTR